VGDKRKPQKPFILSREYNFTVIVERKLLGFLSPSFLRSSGHGYGHLGLIGHGLCFKASSNDNRLAPFPPKNLSGPLQNLTLQHFREVFCDIIITKFENRFARW
jgi:hypothetical protein